MDIPHKSLTDISRLLEEKKITSREVTDAYIAEIEKREDEIHAFVTTTFDLAREMADAADSRISAGKRLSPLDGVPITLKDVVSTKGVRTTASSHILKDYVPPFNATVWERLEAAGCVLLGKTNTDEFTMGGSTEHSAFGATKNPHDTTRVPGGSSGGSAAAVAAGFCAGAVGTDTGGSIRQPAHFCGITGLKVSYGRVSRFGVMPMASSLDTIGPMARTAADCALMLQCMAGKDPRDATTPDNPVPDYHAQMQKPLSGMRIGIPQEYFVEGLDADTRAVMDSSRALLEDMGVTVVDVSLPHTKYALPTYYLIAPSEISANLSKFDGLRFGSGVKADKLEDIYAKTREAGFGAEVKRRILLGTYALSAGYYDAYYRKAQKVRTLIKRDFDTAFESVDALLAPVAPTPAFKIGENINDPLKMYLEDVLTLPASLAGICGAVTPVGSDKDGLPIGVQLMAPAFCEERALRIAHQMQVSLGTVSS